MSSGPLLVRAGFFSPTVEVRYLVRRESDGCQKAVDSKGPGSALVSNWTA
jgi:hypothetical protein